MIRLDKLHRDGSPISEEEWAVLLPEDLPEKYRTKFKQNHQSSVMCIPRKKIKEESSTPILPETMDARIASIRQSIFLLELFDQNRAPIGHGTGFAVTDDGYLLTCGHVVSDAAYVRARLYYPGMIGGERWFEDCEILHPIFEDVDMAVVKINNAAGFIPLTLRDPNETLNAAEAIIVCGYPFGSQLRSGNDPRFVPSHFFGTISSVQGEGTTSEKVFIGCEAKQGNSGSPVISRIDGKVIGILRDSEINQLDRLTEEINYFGPIRFAWERFVTPV